MVRIACAEHIQKKTAFHLSHKHVETTILIDTDIVHSPLLLG